MRTTVTLDPDVERLVRTAMRERGLSFKEAVNAAIRAGAAPAPRSERSVVPTRAMGTPTIDLTKALQVAGELEDEELRRKLASGK